MAKKILLTAFGLLVLIGALGSVKFLQIKTMMAAGYSQPPETVTTAVAAEESWAPTLSAVGSLAAIQGITVAAELDGNVAKIAFEPGSSVQAGALLVQQDTGVERAELEAAKAAVALARVNLDRARQLLADRTISQSQFDSDEAAYKQADAQADNIRAVIAKKTIEAPFPGRLGIRLVSLGQTLKAGDPIVSLQALDPIFVNFYLPQQDIDSITTGMTVRVTCDALPGKVVEGRITAINPDVDSETRNVRVQATLANADEVLRPGMFVNATVVLPAREPVLAIPAASVLYAPYGDSVFVVHSSKDAATGGVSRTIQQRFIELGDERGDYVAVTGGLKAGDVVVSSGAFKLRNGEPVMVNNALAMPAQIAPSPKNS